MDKLKNLNTEKFSDINQIAEKALLCNSRKQAKIYQKYFQLYDKAVKRNNPPQFQSFPTQFIPVVQHLNKVVGDKRWYENTILNWLMGLPVGLLVAFITFKLNW